MPQILDGKKVSEYLTEQLKTDVAYLIDRGIHPHLAAILVGNDPASMSYVRSKKKACEKIGIISTIYHLPENTSTKDLLEHIKILNEDKTIHGIIVQLPLPKHINEEIIIDNILPQKDVDGFHPLNVGRMVLNKPLYLPATPSGILELLKFYNIQTEGKHCVVVGRSHIVGLPISILMSLKHYPGNATVTLCHTKTQNIQFYTKQADILIVAAGKPNLITKDMVKEGAVVIDVGIHRIPDQNQPNGYKIIGDVDFDNVYPICSYITPVPGGVGPMTIASLLKNTVRATQLLNNIDQSINY